MKIINIVGARPNFMKMAPIVNEMKNAGINQVLVHTGQHYDHKMSKLFFEDLALPRPHINLEVGSGTHAGQTGDIMKKVEPVFITERPDLILVVGDVNSTLACAITASKLGIPVAHVEAGLRSFDRTMPEEINRVLTDAISDCLFVSEDSGIDNLKNEGMPEEKIFFVGNTMIDTLLEHRKKAESISPLGTVHIKNISYGVVTLHRPNNVENRENLKNIIEALAIVSRGMPLIFPVHPRTVKKIDEFGLRGMLSEIRGNVSSGIYMTEPLGYLNFLGLMAGAGLVFTDSGGIQEETTVLGIPCITLRDNTERPVTITYGTNVLAGADKNKIIACAKERLNGYGKDSGIPELWDGKAAKRIVSVLIDKFSG